MGRLYEPHSIYKVVSEMHLILITFWFPRSLTICTEKLEFSVKNSKSLAHFSRKFSKKTLGKTSAIFLFFHSKGNGKNILYHLPNFARASLQ